MTKTELINNIAKKTELDYNSCVSVIDALADEVRDCLVSGDRLMLKNFIVFEVVEKPERRARNPKTDKIEVFPAVKTVKCKISKIIKDAINGK